MQRVGGDESRTRSSWSLPQCKRVFPNVLGRENTYAISVKLTMAEGMIEPLPGRGQARPLRKRVACFPLGGAGLAPTLGAISSPTPGSRVPG
ncbi:MAG TPA: hypothetical protein VEL31_30720 [Ktedonobacteraceae bacterium]|nr:hypothetical protein [Ktedonobacteraceae bacterium]